MGQTTGIEWTHHTWSPWWGCTKVSSGCAHCYADSVANRWGFKIWGQDVGRRFFKDAHWHDPIRWNRDAEAAGQRRRIFPSMCDPFEDRPDLAEPQMRLFHLVEETPWLDWCLLTKRPENMLRLAPASWKTGWPKNAWAMASVEDQKTANQRIPELLNVPASLYGLSIEPLLGPIDLIAIPCRFDAANTFNALDSFDGDPLLKQTDNSAIGWVILGGESGPKARPMHPDWARSIRDQCQYAGTPFFFKQWGEWAPWDFDSWDPMEMKDHKFEGDEPVFVYRVGKADAGRELDCRTWDEIPEVAA